MTLLLDRPAPIDDATRRQFLIGGASLAALLAGCGRTDRDNSAAAPGGDGAFPVRIDHLYGTTVIPTEPKRIVTLGLNDQDAVYALGEQPVASTDWLREKVVFPWSEEAAAGATPQILPFELNIEAVTALAPDLILGIFADITEEQYSLLSKIAPTISGHPDYPVYFTPWQEQTRMIGRALGRERQAVELVEAVDQKLAGVAARHPEWDGASAVLASYYSEGQLYVYEAGNSGSYLLESLGFVIPAELVESREDPKQIPALSAERFDLIDVDLILWDSDRDSVEASGILDVPTFQNLDAVREGRQVVPDTSLAPALSFRTVLSIPWALERLEPQIVAAFDGDPTTR